MSTLPPCRSRATVAREDGAAATGIVERAVGLEAATTDRRAPASSVARPWPPSPAVLPRVSGASLVVADRRCRFRLRSYQFASSANCLRVPKNCRQRPSAIVYTPGRGSAWAFRRYALQMRRHRPDHLFTKKLLDMSWYGKFSSQKITLNQ